MNAYQRLCTEFYDLDKPTAPSVALEFYRGYAQRANGPILEAMCGSGRFLVPLAQMGFDIEGVDASPSMLEACRAKCRALGLNPLLRQQFLHQLERPRKYKLVLIAAGSFGLIVEPMHVQESLRRMRDVLRPAGTLLLETVRHVPRPSGPSPWGGRWIHRPDGARLMISWLSDHDDEHRVTRSIHRYELFKDGKLLETEFEEFDLKSYDCGEITRLLIAVGFKNVEVVTRSGADDDLTVVGHAP